MGELPGYLEKARTSLGEVSTVLRRWSNDLSSMKRTAAQYEQAAAQATSKDHAFPVWSALGAQTPPTAQRMTDKSHGGEGSGQAGDTESG
ncbi:MAG: hypothetical protein ACRDTC_06760 [Pseudonocardiaceae bacterium]